MSYHESMTPPYEQEPIGSNQMITKQKWEKIMEKASAGDPIKDVTDIEELLEHAVVLRTALNALCKAHVEVCPKKEKCGTLLMCQRVLEKGEA